MATFIGSPNYNTARSTIDRIVIHWMVGTLKSTDNVFQLSGGVSAHYGIENTTVHQYVREDQTAFHAGSWDFNLRSIGIEHSAAPGRDATKSTIDTSAKLVASLCKKYKIPCDRKHILKHSEITATQCPGTIPIDSIISKANSIIKGDTEVIANQNHVDHLFVQFLGRHANATEKSTWVKRTLADFLNTVYARRVKVPELIAERDALKAQLAEGYEQVTEPLFRRK